MRKRGKRFQKHVDPLAAFRAAGRQHPLDGSQKTTLAVALRVHLQALATGKADASSFHNLANGVNISMVLAERGIGIDHSDLIAGAQEATLKLLENGAEKFRWILDGPNLSAMKSWLDLYEAQLESISQQAAMDAVEEVGKRRNSGMVFPLPPEMKKAEAIAGGRPL